MSRDEYTVPEEWLDYQMMAPEPFYVEVDDDGRTQDEYLDDIADGRLSEPDLGVLF